MKKYIIKNPFRFIVVLLMCIFLFNTVKSNIYKSTYAEIDIDNNIEVGKLEKFIKEFSTIPKELREQIEVEEEVAIGETIKVISKQNHKINSVFEDKEFTVSAYDLSYQSCGKKPSSRSYGITRNGFDLKGHTWQTARVIAVDPKVIPLGSLVYIQFIDENYFKYNSVYLAEDTGSAIKGRKIDLFIEDIGEEVSEKAMDFGVTKARIIILNKNGGI